MVLFRICMTSRWSVAPAAVTATTLCSVSQVPEVTNYTMVGRTYRYFQGDPLYPFGYGLSYTTFKYSDLSVSPEVIAPEQNVTVKVTVLNTGRMASDEVHVHE